MNNIKKHILVAALLMPTHAYAAMYDPFKDDNPTLFDTQQFGSRAENKSQKIIGLIKQAENSFKKGDLQKSEQTMLKALTVAKGNLKAEAKLLSILGEVYAKQQKAEKLLPLAQDIIRRYPGETIALSILAGAQMVNKQYQQSEKTLRKIISKELEDTNHRLLLVDVLIKQENKQKEVESLLNDILKIQANNPKALLLKTKLQIEQKQFTDALKTIKVMEGFYPKKAFVPQIKADLQLAEKNYEGALALYQHAYQIRPNNKVLFIMVDLLKVLKKESKAFDLLNNELKKNNNNLAVHFKLGVIYQQKRNYLQAEKHFKAILNKQENNIIVLNNLAWNYLKQGKPEALALAKKVYDKAPKSPDIADTYAVILLEQGDKKLALDILKVAVKAAPKSMDIQYHLALAYSKNAQKRQAIKILQNLEKQSAYFSEKKAASELLSALIVG